MVIENVDMQNIYGEGIYGNYSPNSAIRNCMILDVSGDNPGLTDSFGGAVTLERGCFSSIIENCFAFNTRTYQTDTVGGYNNLSAKDTPCGYIGFWTEFPMNVDGNIPPLGSSFGLTGNDKNYIGNGLSSETFGIVVRNCFAYGYTLGFKAEGGVPTLFDGCAAINCWIPCIMSGTRGLVRGCYADAMNLDGLICPQGGFNYCKINKITSRIRIPLL